MQYRFPILLLSLLLSGGCDPYPGEPGAVRHTILSSPPGETAVPCVRDGTVPYPSLHTMAGQMMAPGVDPYGYNYLEHSFTGLFANRSLAMLGLAPVEEGKATLRMLWNEAWLSNSDRDGDGRLDRHPGRSNYRGSGAWLTVHLEGEENGAAWVTFLKIAAVPEHAELKDGVWVADDVELGPSVWGCFAVIMEFSTSPAGLEFAAEFKRRFPGLGLE